MKKFKCLSIILILLVLVCGCGKEKVVESKKENESQQLILKEELNFEINAQSIVSDVVSDDNKLELINGNDAIDTTTLGEKEIMIKYKENSEEKEQTVKIKVVDTTKPVIEASSELSTEIGTKIDLIKNVKVTDNSKEDIKVSVEGNYDFNKEGTYKLKYVAKDSSNNVAEKEFTLKVTTATIKLGENEYISLKDNQIHKYTFTYPDEATCKKLGDVEPYEIVYPNKPYVVFGCEEVKDAKGNILWGEYFYERPDENSKFYW